MTSELKTCPRCEQTKPITEYLDDRTYCRGCHRKLSRELMRKYTATMRGKASKALSRNRKRAAEYGVYDDLTLHDILFVFAISNGECAYCGKVTENYELEHIVSFKHGGKNTLSNTTVSCKNCNSSKRNEPLLSWHGWTDRSKNAGILQTIERMALRRGVDSATIIDELQQQAEEYAFGGAEEK